MKKTAVAFVFCYGLLNTAAWACGDKLLHLSRIYRMHGLDKTVMVFARPDSLLENVAALNLDKAFREEGYHLLLVNSNHDLALALQSGAADVVIADIADAAVIARSGAASKIPIIPVVSKNDPKSEADAKGYVASIKSPAKAGKFLDAIDRAFNSKSVRENARLQPVSASIR
jgi:hypothetical protein